MGAFQRRVVMPSGQSCRLPAGLVVDSSPCDDGTIVNGQDMGRRFNELMRIRRMSRDDFAKTCVSMSTIYMNTGARRL